MCLFLQSYIVGVIFLLLLSPTSVTNQITFVIIHQFQAADGILIFLDYNITLEAWRQWTILIIKICKYLLILKSYLYTANLKYPTQQRLIHPPSISKVDENIIAILNRICYYRLRKTTPSVFLPYPYSSWRT